MSNIESFNALVSRMEQLLVALKALGWGGADVEAEFEGVTRSSLEKRFAELVASSEIDFATADEILNEMVELREEAINARNAALLSRGVFSSTAEALSYGVASLASLVGGSGGTDGIFDLAFSSGGGADAAGRFVVAGGSVVSYIITATGRNFTYTPSVSFAASAGLTGASATPVIATNVSVGEFFCTPAPGAFLQLYRVDAGPVAYTQPDWTYPNSDVLATKKMLGIESAIDTESGPFLTRMVRDSDGNLRVLEVVPELGEAAYYGLTPNAYKDEVFGISVVITYETLGDPDRIEMVRDEDGNLRVIQAIGKSVPDACIFGAGATENSAQNPPTEFVMFVTAGQSNMAGVGASFKSEIIPAGVAFQYFSGSLTAVTGDPIGNADSGSCLPAFANEFFRRTGMGVIFVPTADPGSGLTATASLVGNGGNGNSWDTSGTLRGILASRYAAAVTACNSAGLAWRFGGMLWSQGERDGRELPSAGNTITATDYTTAFDNLRTYLDGTFGTTKWPWIISQTGGDTEGIDAAGLADMRELQRTIVKTRSNVLFGWTGAFNLIARGLMRVADFPSDPVDQNRSHCSQQGYNEMGHAMATVAASVAIGNA